MHVRKGDEVLVITGNYKGKRGRVLKVFPKKNRVIVEGINFIKRHTRQSQQFPQGGIIEREAPIHASNVMVICPGNNKPTRVSTKVLDGEGKKSRNRVRYSKKYDEIIPAGE
jgi:large subunit ribosomal protein L24